MIFAAISKARPPLSGGAPRRALDVLTLAAALCFGSTTAQAIPGTPAGMLETGAPSFAVLSSEALGLNTPPVDLHLMPDGRVLVVSQREFAFGDGVRWETFRGAEDQRAVLTSVVVDHDGQIYTGEDNGISRIELGEGARWRFRPVAKPPTDGTSPSVKLLSVVETPEHWYWFGGDGAVVSWKPGQTARVAGRVGIVDGLYHLRREVYISYQSIGGFLRLKADGTAEQVTPRDLMVTDGVTCGVPFGPDQLLVGTISAGLKLFDGENFRPFGPPKLPGNNHRIIALSAAGEGFFAAAIESVGIVFFDREGRMVQALDRSLDHRLARVQRLRYGSDGVLWALLNDGVARVEFPSPISHYGPLLASGLAFAQPLRHAGQLWILADGRAMHGIYDASGRLERLEDNTPPGRFLFTLAEVDGRLFGCNEAGIYVYEATGWRSILPGIENARLILGQNTTDGIFYVALGEYGIIQRKGGEYTARRIPMPELGGSYGSAVDAEGIGWMELGQSRVGRLDPRGAQPTLRIFGPADGVPEGWIQLYLFEGVARFHLRNELYRVDDTQQKFVEDRELLARLPQLAAAGGRPVTDSLGRLWYTLNGSAQAIDRTAAGGGRPVKIPAVGFAPTIYTTQDDGVVWMFGRGRLVRMDPRLPLPTPKPLRALITSVQFPASGRELFAPGGALGSLDYTDNSLVLRFAAPANPFAAPVTFEVLLEGTNTGWVSTGAVGSAVFNRLKEGDYVFRVRPVVAGTASGTEARLQFNVRPPWFRTRVAWATYVAAAVGLFVFSAWLSSYLQRRENARLEHLVAARTSELNATNAQLGRQIEETMEKSAALAVSEERYRSLNTELENRVQERTAKLAETHQKLLVASREAGMAEVATGVLHNVGNVLNSVNVSATLVEEGVRCTKAAQVAKLAALLDERKADLGAFLTTDPRGRTVPAYLNTLANTLSVERSAMLDEIGQLRKNIEHIREIVSMQQSFARPAGITETVAVADLVEDALRMNTAALTRHGVETTRDFRARPIVTVDRHKVMQILVNLVGNAKQACDESGRPDKRVVVRIAADERSVAISVIDNGVGIPAENLTRIFNHGFTTKKNGHGFGLHSGALAAKELGGSLNVQSDGPGKGASFTLVLPLDTAVSRLPTRAAA